jgi:hypothetical protein
MKVTRISKRDRRKPDWDRRHGSYAEQRRAYEAHPRLYIHVKDEGVLANFANRTSRPVTLYRSVLPEILRAAGLDPARVQVRWSQYAGCTMCPCSPGFVLRPKERGAPHLGSFDVWADVTGDDAARAAGPEAESEAAGRLGALLGDPTIVGALAEAVVTEEEAAARWANGSL